MRTIIYPTWLLLPALALISYYQAFWVWEGRSTALRALAFLVVLLTVFFFSSSSSHRRPLSRSALLTVSLWLLLTFWVHLPFRPYSEFFPTMFLTPAVPVLLLLLPPHTRRRLLDTIFFLFIVFSIGSLIVVSLLAVGLDLPSIRIDQTFRKETYPLHFDLYLTTIVMSNQYFPTPWGGSFARSSGVFVEPGHFGLLLALLLATKGFSLKTRGAKILLLGGLSTFSGSFLSMLLLGVLLTTLLRIPSLIRQHPKHILVLLLLLAAVPLLFTYLPESLQDRILFSRFSPQAGVIELRTDPRVTTFFWNHCNTYRGLLGLGNRYDDLVGAWSVGIYGFLIAYGWLTLFPVILFFLSLILPTWQPLPVRLSILLSLLIAFLHRSNHTFNPLVLSIVFLALYSRDLHPPLQQHSPPIPPLDDARSHRSAISLHAPQ